MKPKQVTVRLYGALNDFLAPERRGTEFLHPFTGSPSVKALLESLGPPHPELDVVLVNGEAVDFTRRLEGGESVVAQPAFLDLDVAAPGRVGASPLGVPRLILDGDRESGR